MLPFVATVVGLTMLYWRVPYTHVRLRNALAGGLLAGILLEILREGFGSYVEVFRNVSIVYGSYAFALLFMISLDLTWTIILFGAVATYTAQHFSLLARGLHRHPPVQAAWVGLATLALIARRFDGGEPPLSREALADRMCLPTMELERILRPLAIQGPLQLVGDHGYALSADPRQIRVEEVLAAYDHRARRGAELVGEAIAAHLQDADRRAGGGSAPARWGTSPWPACWRPSRPSRTRPKTRPCPRSPRRLQYRPPAPWGSSSAGRAPRSQRGGRGFESLLLHHLPSFSSPAKVSRGATGALRPAGRPAAGVGSAPTPGEPSTPPRSTGICARRGRASWGGANRRTARASRRAERFSGSSGVRGCAPGMSATERNFRTGISPPRA